MKLGTFTAALCAAATSSALAAPNHAAAIEQYRKAYETNSDPHLLTLIADEYRAAGNARDALSYYCAYMYVAAAGADADYASANARELAVKFDRLGDTDHDACTPKGNATDTETIDLVPPRKPASISKREIVGLSMLGAGVAGLSMALYEQHALAAVQAELVVKGPNADALAQQADDHTHRERLWLVVGGVSLFTGGLLYVIGRHDRKLQDHALSISPTVHKGGGGLVFGGMF